MTGKRWFWARRRSWGTLLGFVAVLFQMSIPLGQGMASAAFAGGSGQDALPPLVICSAMGGISQIPAEGNSNAPANQTTPCPFCIVCCQVRPLNLDFLPAYDISIPLPKITAWAYPEHFDGIRLSESVATRHPPRAPPSFT